MSRLAMQRLPGANLVSGLPSIMPSGRRRVLGSVIRTGIACLLLMPSLIAYSAVAAIKPTTLSEVFDAAHEMAPSVRAAEASAAVSRARSRQALGAMLPQLSLTASANGNRRNYNTHDDVTDTMHDRYHAHSYQLSLNQPIWRPANTSTWHQAQESQAQADYQLADAEQKLYAKLASAWFDLMQARDELEFSRSQTEALRERWKMARRGGELGTQGAPQAAEAEAKYREAAADEASAELDRDSKLALLEQWTGPADGLVQPYLREDATLPDLVGKDLDAWLNQIDVHCPSLHAANKAIEAANDEIRKQRAGHSPTLDLVASYGTNDQAVGNFPGQAGYGIRTFTVGLQLNVPLYSGGTQSAKVAESLAERDKALADRDETRRQAILDIKTSFFEWRSGLAKAEASRATMKSTRLAWIAAAHGEQQGLKTHADVLDARQQWMAARRNMRKGRYQQMAAYVKLRATLGELSSDDVDELDRLFVATDSEPSLTLTAGAEQ
ncbi:TolC family outer membrane protein [Dyella ginsengisoli]|uniref:TolC family outer membrane protein n=1 Tax=Dyella ginsengisoli TaxID=363848 RepID=A0ABW8JZ14_9GAMM